MNILLNAWADVNKYHPQDVEKRTLLVQVVLAAVKSADSIQLPGCLRMIDPSGASRPENRPRENEGRRDKFSSRRRRIVAAV